MEQRSAKSVSEVYLLLFALCFVFLQHTVLADCPMPDADFDNGVILYEREWDFNLTIAPESSVLRFECDRGYETFGANIIALRVKWTASIPRCVYYSKCGLGLESLAKPERARVVNGNKAVEPWPWMAALYITDSRTEDHKWKCGGSIIGQQWILTAAHCLGNVDDIVVRRTYQVRIKLGLTDIKNSTYLQNFEASEFFVHEAYSPLNHDYDIALIKLNGIVEYNTYVRPICLPHDVIPEDSPLYKDGEPAFVAGWGHDETIRVGQIVALKSQRNLKELLAPLQSRERCLDSILDIGGTRNMFTDQMLCAGKGDGTGDTCIGDGGGPLIQSQLNKEKNVFWTQVGLVSWGIGCNQLNHYGFYTHVYKLLPWIKNVMKNAE